MTSASALDIDTDDDGRRQHVERAIVGGLLHAPGHFTRAGCERIGLVPEAISDSSLRSILHHIIDRGQIAVWAALKGSDVSPAAAAARKLYAETVLLDPANLIGLVRDLVTDGDEPEHIEVEESDSVAGVPAT
jgi:hypothetical protein